MNETKGKLIFKTCMAAVWNVLCLIGIWFFVRGIIDSIALDMSEFVWIWCVMIALFLFLLVLSIRYAVFLRKVWRKNQKA